MRALFVGGAVAGTLREVGDPPAEHVRIPDDGMPLYLPDSAQAQRSRERDYHRRDFAVELGGEVRRFTVYLAPAELFGFTAPHLHPHLVRHVTLQLDKVGLIDLPKGPA